MDDGPKPLTFDPPPKKTDPRRGWTSASNAEADELCPGRHQAQKGLPELQRPEGWDTFGTAIHNALAVEKPGSLAEEALQVYESCLEVRSKVVEQFFGSEVNDLMTKAHERFWFWAQKEPKGKKLWHSGEVDRIYLSKTKALIIDYKTLPGDNGVGSNNKQLRDLAVMVSGNIGVKVVGVVVIQPLVTMSPEICVYEDAHLKEAAHQQSGRIVGSHEPNAPRKAGKVQCTYCKAQASCREYQEFATAQLPEMRDFADNPVQSWTAEQCAVFLDRLPVARKWLEFTLAAIRKRVEAGEVPGFTIGQGDRKFEVLDMAELAKRCETLGIPNAELVQVCTPGKAELTRLMRNKLGLKGGALNKKVAELFAGIVSEDRKKGSIEKVEALLL